MRDLWSVVVLWEQGFGYDLIVHSKPPVDREQNYADLTASS